MRIVHFTHRLYPDIGGVELAVETLAKHTAEQGHDVTVVTETNGGTVRCDRHVRVLHLHVTPRRPFTRVGYWRWMWRRRAEWRGADVLHFHDYGTFINWFFPLRFIVRRPVYAMTFHGFDSWPVRRKDNVLRSMSARCMDVTFGAGSFIRKHYRQRIDHEYVGAPLRAIPESRRAPDSSFLFIGRLEPDTGIRAVVQTLAEAATESRRHCRLVVVGEGSEAHAVESCRNEWLGIEMHPKTDKVESHLSRASFMIGTGFLSVLDAFAGGIPVIAPALTPIKYDYFESLPDAHRCLLFVRSVDELRDLFTGLIDGRYAQRAFEAALNARRFAETLSWSTLASMHIDHYAKHR